MKMQKELVEISPAIGKISTISLIPKDSNYLMILGHGAGANMEHRFMQGLSEALADRGIATLRYNFPYMEHKKGRPDTPKVAHETIIEVINYAKGNNPDLPLILAGKSFGGRMASQVMANIQSEVVKALVFYGFPLHSPAKPGIERGDHLFKVRVPMLFLQGNRDTLAKEELLKPLIERLDLAHLKMFSGGDHSFKFPKKSGIDEIGAFNLLADATNEFLQSLNIDHR